MHTLTINRQNFYFPEKWEDLTAQQFLYICRLTLGDITINDLQVKLLLYFTGIKVFTCRERIFKGIDHYLIGTSAESAWWVSTHDLFFTANALKFLFKEIKDKDGNYVCHDFDCRLVNNIIPMLEVQHPFLPFGKKLFGPASGLTNLTFDEYIHAETNIIRYRETKKPEYLYKFIAVLYRPAKSWSDQKSQAYNGDIRLSFNDAFIDKWAYRIAKLPPEYHKAILLWYDGCKLFLASQFPNVFKRSADDDDEQEIGTTFRSFMKLVDTMADSDVTKKPDIRKQYLMDVMESLEQMSIKAQKQQEEMEKYKNK